MDVSHLIEKELSECSVVLAGKVVGMRSLVVGED